MSVHNSELDGEPGGELPDGSVGDQAVGQDDRLYPVMLVTEAMFRQLLANGGTMPGSVAPLADSTLVEADADTLPDEGLLAEGELPEADVTEEADYSVHWSGLVPPSRREKPTGAWPTTKWVGRIIAAAIAAMGCIFLVVVSIFWITEGGFPRFAACEILAYFAILGVAWLGEGRFIPALLRDALIIEFCLTVAALSIWGIVDGGFARLFGSVALAILLLLIGLRWIRGPVDEAEAEFKRYLQGLAEGEPTRRGRDYTVDPPQRLLNTLVESKGEYVVAAMRKHPITILFHADPFWRGHLRGIAVIAFFWGIFMEAKERFGKGDHIVAQVYHTVISIALFVFVGVPAFCVSFVLYKVAEVTGVQDLLWIIVAVFGLLLAGSIYYRIKRWRTEVLAVIARGDGTVTKVIILQNLISAKDTEISVAWLTGFKVVEHSLASWAGTARFTWLKIGTLVFKEEGEDPTEFRGLAGARAFRASGIVAVPDQLPNGKKK